MKVIVPTIQHTGSFFITRHLLAFMAERHLKEDKPGLYFSHTMPHNMERFVQLLSDNKGVTPLRHPREIVTSWERRGKDFDALFLQTRNLISIAHMCYVLPIDAKDRNDRLIGLRGWLGMPLSTDWPVIHSVEKAHTLEDEDSYRAYIDEFGSFFGEFYPET